MQDSKKASRRKSLMALGLGCLLLLAILVMPLRQAYEEARTSDATEICVMGVKQMGTGIGLYGADHDERYPLAANWHDATAKYWKGTALRCPMGETPSTYAMNRAVAGKKESDFADPSNTIAIFEQDGSDRNQTGGAESVVYRHGPRSNFSTGDGTHYWLTKGKPTTFRWKP